MVLVSIRRNALIVSSNKVMNLFMRFALDSVVLVYEVAPIIFMRDSILRGW